MIPDGVDETGAVKYRSAADLMAEADEAERVAAAVLQCAAGSTL